VDEKTFYATVAERAALSKEEGADLTRATLEEIAGQLPGGEIERLAAALPDWLDRHLPRHRGPARPRAFADVLDRLATRTGLKKEEVQRGVQAVLTTLRAAADPTHLEHALALLPQDYRRLAAA
jgi:uncharacterized protein (DUF2267 family)